MTFESSPIIITAQNICCLLQAIENKLYSSMKQILYLALLLVIASSRWTPTHTITGDASRQLANGIRAQLLNNMVYITNPVTRQALTDDLNEPDDSKRKLTSIDTPTASVIFEIFQLTDPKCDKNNDGVVTGNELKCFGKIWKNFVPNG